MSDYQEFVDYLKKQTPGEIAWGDDHVTHLLDDGERWFWKWVDVQVDAWTRDLSMNWVWTVGKTDDRPDDSNDLWFTVDLDYDLDVYCVWDYHDYNDPEKLYVVVPHGQPLTDEQRAALAACIAENPDGRDMHMLGGWRESTINAALAAWVRQHAGIDLTFRHDPDHATGPMARAAITAIEEIKAGTAESYQIGETDAGYKIMASDQVFQTLADAPPELTAEIINILGSLPSNPEGEHDDGTE